MNPLQVLQMLSVANQHRNFEQEYSARQPIGQAYKDRVSPTGEVDALMAGYPGISTGMTYWAGA
jgi:hypothetical protein